MARKTFTQADLDAVQRRTMAHLFLHQARMALVGMRDVLTHDDTDDPEALTAAFKQTDHALGHNIEDLVLR